MSNNKKELNFIVAHEQYNAQETGLLDVHPDPAIMIFCLLPDDTFCEATFVFGKHGIEFQMFDDAWKAIHEVSELTELMNTVSDMKKSPSIGAFTDLLKEAGFEDKTNRKKPDNGVKPVLSKTGDSYVCPVCHAEGVFRRWRFCAICGTAFAWDKASGK